VSTGPSRRVSLLIVDDHAVTRAGVASIMSASQQVDVLGEASSLSEARQWLARVQPDVVIVDVRLTDGSGLDLVRERAGQRDAPKFVVFTMFAGPEIETAALAAGAAAVVDKNAASSRLVQKVLELGKLVRPPRETDDGLALSPREVEVTILLVRGWTNAEIASQLGVGSATVRTHVDHVLAKLGARDRTEAAVIAVRRGIADLGALTKK